MTTKNKDLEINLSPEIEAKLATDPKMAEAVRDLMAMFRQAHEGVQTGKYKSMDDAMELLTGSRPVKVDLNTGEPIKGSMDVDLGLDEDQMPDEDDEKS